MKQLSFYKDKNKNSDLITLKEAANWASEYLNRNVAVSNISYLLQYGRIINHGVNGDPLLSIAELKNYYDSYDKEHNWKKTLGNDLNWRLSFVEYKESERTKHVHRLHPYKGKFIPQLVEYFLDSHTDEFKKQVYFSKGDIILDPFCGSGTTLVQANELGMHAIGIDISAFNALISNVKVGIHDIKLIKEEIKKLTCKLMDFIQKSNITDFDNKLLFELTKFNTKYFSSPSYKRDIRFGKIQEDAYSKEKEKEFLGYYNELVKRYKIKITQDEQSSFLDKWFLYPVRKEIEVLFKEIVKVENTDVRNILSIILSRTVRSCRATTHADLGTLIDPVTTTYYCKKHGKMCKPIFSIGSWWQRYTIDTMSRLRQFESLKTDTFQTCLVGDSRSIDLIAEAENISTDFVRLLKKQLIKGIFSSPPYVGLIDYHEQHAYSYEIFGFTRNDNLEIGPMASGQGREARNAYVRGIAGSLNNLKNFFRKDYDIFLVANDKYNLYPEIAKQSNMKIVETFKRPVLNRVEKDRSNAYSETIFHLKESRNEN